MIPRILTPHTGYLPDAKKLAILDGELADQEHWETTEYWNPHAGHYLQTISTLLKGEGNILW